MPRKTLSVLCLVIFACSDPAPSNTDDPVDTKEDSGWLSNTSFEVDALVTGRVQVADSYQWEDLATDEGLQMDLIDLQIKFIKNESEDQGYRMNQLVDSVQNVVVTSADGLITLEYEAVVDMISAHLGPVPSFEELDPREFDARIPLDPTDVYSRVGDGCANDPSHVAGYNYPYYFDPDREGCTIDLEEVNVRITEVFERNVAYPEYDQLMLPHDDGTVGFSAAIVPARGDNDSMSRFDALKSMLEDELELDGQEASDGESIRYEWEEAGVKIVIDLFDPTQNYFTSTFQSALGEYELVFYNGHSAYGTQRLLTNPEAFSDAYQILMLHSCQSYAYFVQQAFRAKATAEDPTGMALTDFVATGRSSYPSGSPRTLAELLKALQRGLHAIHTGNAEEAPDWLSIVGRMNTRVRGILYGVAGVRTNVWQPAGPTPTNTLLDETGEVQRDEEVRFEVTAPEEATQLRFEMRAEGDPDLYVRQGAPPTASDFDCRPYHGANRTEVCDFTPEAGQVYHVMVRGYSAASYGLTVTYE